MTKHQRRTAVLFLPIVLLLAVADASAQDKGDTGITMGYPASVGFVFHVSDRFAIRPELNLNVSSAESDSQFGSSSSSDELHGGRRVQRAVLSPSDGQAAPVRRTPGTCSSVRAAPRTRRWARMNRPHVPRVRRFFWRAVLPARPLQRLRRGRRQSLVRFPEYSLWLPASATLRSENRVTGIRSGVGVIFYF